MKKLAIGVVFLAVIAAIGAIAGDSENFNLQKKINEETKKVQEIQKNLTELEASQKEWQKNHHTRMADKNKERHSVTHSLLTLKKTQRLKRNELFLLKAKILSIERTFSLMDTSMKKSLQLEKRITGKSIPFEKEKRESALLRLISDINQKSYKTEELYNRFTTLLYRDLLMGFDSSTSNDGTYRYLRLGHIYMARINLEKNEASVLGKKGNSYEWVSVDDPLYIKAIEDAMKIVEGKKSPEHIRLPIHLSLIKMKGEKE